MQVRLEGVVVKGGEFGCVVEVGIHRVIRGMTLVENVQVELVRPPLLVGRRAHVVLVEHRALFFGHGFLAEGVVSW